MELLKRKEIRLKNYDYSENGYYFITICTYNSKNLFFQTVGANLCVRPNRPDLVVVKWLLEIENKYKNVKIQKYVIMPNHIHFVLSITSITGEHAGSPLHEMIKWFKTQTTNEFIVGVKKGLYQPFDKHIWQRNYYEHIIRNKNSYHEIWKYIEENPCKWELDKYYNIINSTN